MEDAIEVKAATLETFEGETKQVHGGVWLPPEEYLRLSARHERSLEAVPPSNNTLLLVGVGAALLGVSLGWWLSRDDD
jgi:hypothetical protein